MFNQKIIFGLCLLALGACEKRLDGTMRVTSTLSVKTKNNTVSLAPGNYTTVVRASNKSSTVTMKSGNKNVSFTLPAIAELKNKWGSGRKYIKGSQIGQNFDVDLNLNVTSEDSGSTSRDVSCVYDTHYYQEWVCREYDRTVCNNNGECMVVRESDCGYETRSEDIMGTRTEYGYYNTMNRSGTLKLIRGGKTVAYLLDNKQSKTSWITTSSGSCNRY